mmetsp:Transcript_19738/g.51941  ORF Transcript_19738/g.51941 Transcript_19738/m.51941 type:complete len:202 (+) Transcript_19738:47-652(+)
MAAARARAPRPHEWTARRASVRVWNDLAGEPSPLPERMMGTRCGAALGGGGGSATSAKSPWGAEAPHGTGTAMSSCALRWQCGSVQMKGAPSGRRRRDGMAGERGMRSAVASTLERSSAGAARLGRLPWRETDEEMGLRRRWLCAALACIHGWERTAGSVGRAAASTVSIDETRPVAPTETCGGTRNSPVRIDRKRCCMLP